MLVRLVSDTEPLARRGRRRVVYKFDIRLAVRVHDLLGRMTLPYQVRSSRMPPGALNLKLGAEETVTEGTN